MSSREAKGRLSEDRKFLTSAILPASAAERENWWPITIAATRNLYRRKLSSLVPTRPFGRRHGHIWGARSTFRMTTRDLFGCSRSPPNENTDSMALGLPTWGDRGTSCSAGFQAVLDVIWTRFAQWALNTIRLRRRTNRSPRIYAETRSTGF